MSQEQQSMCLCIRMSTFDVAGKEILAHNKRSFEKCVCFPHESRPSWE